MIDIIQGVIYGLLPSVVNEGFTNTNRQVEHLTPELVKKLFQRESSCRLYVSEIDSRSWFLKTSGGAGLDEYLSYMDYFTPENKQQLSKSLRLLPTSPLLRGVWRFAKTSDNLELGMPYTLGDVVFLPPGLLHSVDYHSVSKTLCHERIHILQRKYQSVFDQFIYKVMKFTQIQVLGDLPVIPFANPDGPQSPQRGWIFRHRKKWYYPLLIMTPSDTLSRVGIQLKITDGPGKVKPVTATFTDIIEPIATLLEDKYPTCPKNHLYHPYEILAELGAMFLVDGTSGNRQIDDFYNKLTVLSRV